MSLSIAEREKLWDDFLAAWPAERLASMTLDAHTHCGAAHAWSSKYGAST